MDFSLLKLPDLPIDQLEEICRKVRVRRAGPNIVENEDERERRWMTLPSDVRLLAQRDAHLRAFIDVYLRWRYDLAWLTKSYLASGWEQMQRMLGDMEIDVRHWQSLWPEWEDPTGAAIDSSRVSEQAARKICAAARILNGQMQIYSGWKMLALPAPLRILGIKS